MALARDLIAIIDEVARNKEDKRETCFYCGKPLGDRFHVDHVVPKRLSGADAHINKVRACPSCNLSKNGKHPVYWLLQAMAEVPDEVMLEYVARVLYHGLSVTHSVD